jgi:hypothetical protein
VDRVRVSLDVHAALETVGVLAAARLLVRLARVAQFRSFVLSELNCLEQNDTCAGFTGCLRECLGG